MDAIILCGGKGTRLASVVSDVPKPMAPVNGRPFLDFILAQLAESGLITRFILATGHLEEKIRLHYKEAFRGIPVAYSNETEALGTGGAVLLALNRFGVDRTFLVLNGDSYVSFELRKLIEFSDVNSAPATLLAVKVMDAARFGEVRTEGLRVIRFCEKSGKKAPGVINAGLYCFKAYMIDMLASHGHSFSLEMSLLPSLCASKKLFKYECNGEFIDIGVPESYRKAKSMFSSQCANQLTP